MFLYNFYVFILKINFKKLKTIILIYFLKESLKKKTYRK